jgi:hypothetical protein
MVSVFVMFPPNPPACPGAKTNEMSFTRALCLPPRAYFHPNAYACRRRKIR